MAKLKPTAKLIRSEPSGMCYLLARYDEATRQYLKEFYPWAQWDYTNKRWTMTDAVSMRVASWLARRGWDVTFPTLLVRAEPDKVDVRLHSYQLQDVVSACHAGYRFLAYEMGLGKTPTAISAARAWGAERVLIVCPASVREVWGKEAGKWWPGHPPVCLVDNGKMTVPTGSCVVVCSYELLGVVMERDADGDVTGAAANVWDAIIVDESHNIKNSKTDRAILLTALRDANPKALRLALSGTPVGDQPKDLHAQLDWLTPKRWLSWWRFVNRFCNVERHQYGTSVSGVQNAEDLREQFLQVGSRVTWNEYKHLMPKVLPPQTHRTTDLQHGVADLLETVAQKAVVFTFLRAEAEDTAAYIRRETTRPTFCVTGRLPPVDRARVLEEARSTPGAILVATMDSTGTGIDLTAFPVAIFAGLSYKLQTVLQAIGRVIRLTQKEPVQLHMVVKRGSQSEVVAEILARKLEDSTCVVAGGNAESSLGGLVGPKSIDSAEFLRELEEEITERFGGSDEYL